MIHPPTDRRGSEDQTEAQDQWTSVPEPRALPAPPLHASTRAHHQGAPHRPLTLREGPRTSGGYVLLLPDRDREREQAPLEHHPRCYRQRPRYASPRVDRRRGAAGGAGRLPVRTFRDAGRCPAGGGTPGWTRLTVGAEAERGNIVAQSSDGIVLG